MKAGLLDLLDYRRRVAEMYRLVREQGVDSVDAHARFRRERDELFRLHVQSAWSFRSLTRGAAFALSHR